VVDDSQLSLAIGKKGQNVRLAAKLLNWKIDIKSEEEKRQEVEQQMSQMVTAAPTPLESVPGLGESLIVKLSTVGVTTVEALADMTPEQLEAIEGIGPKTVEKISLAVNNYFSSLETAAAAEGSATAESAEGQPAESSEAAVVAEGEETAEVAEEAAPVVEAAPESSAADIASEGSPEEQPSSERRE
jgi:N utilization substance protein A